MNGSLVATLNKHYIYYVNSNNVNFYISVPYKEFNMTNISIELYGNYDMINPSKNDNVLVRDHVVNIYKAIDNDNISLAIPVFNDDSLKSTDMSVDPNVFMSLDNIISGMINSSYQVLSSSKVQVDSKIYLIDNGLFKNFTSWFLQKYVSRVEFKKITDLQVNNNVQLSNVNTVPEQVQNVMPSQVQTSVSTAQGQEQAYSQVKQVSSPSTGVGDVYNPQMQNVNYNGQVANGAMNYSNVQSVGDMSQNISPNYQASVMNTPNNESVEVPDVNGSAGFISYAAIGTLTVIICLAILYIML